LGEHSDEQPVLRDWLGVLNRHKWIVLVAVVAVPLLALLASQSQQHLYQASSTVLVNQQNPTTAEALNLASPASSPPDRYAATQASLARVDTVANMAAKAANLPGHTAARLLANSSVSADPSVDILTFSVTDPSPAAAVKLANVYAQQFTLFRHRLDTGAVAAAIADARRKQQQLAASGDGGSLLARRLAATERNLEKLQTLQTASSSAQVVGTADSTTLTQPKTKRNLVLGIIVGLALGIALAFIREALDTRVRSADELRARLGVPLLGQVPRPDRRLAPTQQLTTLLQPTGPSTEAFRILKNNLEISQLEHHADAIAVTSTGTNDGKSETAANLAVILARSGRRVALVDLDLRHPRVDKLFGLEGRPGLTEVALGTKLPDALAMVDVHADRRRRDAGTLEVLTAGQPPTDPGEFLLSRYVPEALAALQRRCDVLLIDTPPVLAVGDAMTIAVHADALIVVARVNHVRRDTLAEARRTLEGCPTFTLGIIATGPKAADEGAQFERLRSTLTRARPSPAWRERLVAARNGVHVGETSKEVFATISASLGAIASGTARQSHRIQGEQEEPEGPAPGNGHADPDLQERPQRVPEA
jgi:capsular exopolysaccharide synthesis family protein